MQQTGDETPMVHWQCHICGISATCVLNPPAELAWLDHMENHANKADYSSWTWTALTLSFPE